MDLRTRQKVRLCEPSYVGIAGEKSKGTKGSSTFNSIIVVTKLANRLASSSQSVPNTKRMRLIVQERSNERAIVSKPGKNVYHGAIINVIIVHRIRIMC